MGLGKPLGLGAIEVRIARNGLKARRGRSLAKEYKSLSACLGLAGEKYELSKFSLETFVPILDKLPWVQATQRAAYGYEDHVEVRYMSLDENKRNNQTDNDGNPKNGRGVSPTDLFCPTDPGGYRPAPIDIRAD